MSVTLVPEEFTLVKFDASEVRGLIESAIADTGSGSIMSTIFGQVTTTEKQCTFMPTIGSSVGAVIETYDFIGFGTAAALYFGHAFFPGASPIAGTLASFATLGVGFAARPLGGPCGGRSDPRGPRPARHHRRIGPFECRPGSLRRPPE